jgi:hypothetical protein
MTPETKAYRVDSGDDEGRGIIVFAARNVEARKMGANEFGLDFEEVGPCRRAPEFDGFADLGYVPDEELIKAGWWIECHECSTPIHGDYDEFEPVFEGRSTYCSAACRDAANRNYRMRRRANELGARVLRRQIGKRWPDAEVTRTHVYVCNGRIEQALAEFKFPGSKFGSAKFVLRDRWDKDLPRLSVPRGDIPAWQEYENKVLQDA